MNYISTRNKNEKVESSYAILKGLASDGGLYIPEKLPNIDLSFEKLKNKSYQEIALYVLKEFFPSLDEKDLSDVIYEAYSDVNFRDNKIVPLYKLDNKVGFAELFHGRTLAFKDLALSLFPYLLTLSKEKENERNEVRILTATSGDTGKAALEGFKDIKGISITVFYPKDGVSPMQEDQMRKQKGDNVDVVAIKGNFDDAQTAVKEVFNSNILREEALNNKTVFSSANSINIGRLFPQVVYYITTYVELVKNGLIDENDKFNVSVPTGNFGNILAAYIAKKMGIPIKKLICASNENNVLSDFFNTGTYNKNREFYQTHSPSMDILISSNFERFLYYVLNESSEETKLKIDNLTNNGELSVDKSKLDEIQKEFYGNYTNDEETEKTIKNVYDKYSYLMDPHTAVAYNVYEKYIKETQDDTYTVVMSTAHPFKFPDVLRINFNIEDTKTSYDVLDYVEKEANINFPDPLKEVRNSEVRFSKVIDRENIVDYVLESVKRHK